MDRQLVFEKLAGIVSVKLSIEKSEITEETDFRKDLKTDSLDLAEIVMEIEDEFNVDVSDDEEEKVRTVGDAVKLIQDLLEKEK